MGGLSTRSGFVALQNQTERVRLGILPELRKARFGIISEGGDDEIDAQEASAVLLDISELNDVATEIQLARARFGGRPVVALCAPGPDAEYRILNAFRNGVADAVLMTEERSLDLVDTLRLAIERHRLDDHSRDISRDFSAELGARARGLLQAHADMEAAYESTLHALVRALDVRERATAGHSMRVSYYTCFLALMLDVPESRLKDLYRGALLHDIGKIGIPDSILLKPAKLTTEEFDRMKTHTTLARDFLAGIDYLDGAIDIPYCHHEKWNGQGYPVGLSGETIPLGARIFAIADVYDALRSRRCYKEAMTHAVATGIIDGDSGSHFDPAIVQVFLRIPEESWDRLDQAARRDDNDFDKMRTFCMEVMTSIKGLVPELVS